MANKVIVVGSAGEGRSTVRETVPEVVGPNGPEPLTFKITRPTPLPEPIVKSPVPRNKNRRRGNQFINHYT